uniref:Phosphofructokinase domain-containing protein n=1 Tax=Aegilops tauschii subsp. strangulata TaxID=200361 RepID=A0A453E6F3_AEGTS
MESVGVAPAPAAVAVAEQKMKLLEPRKEPLASAAAAAKAPCKWAMKKKLVGGDAGYVLEDVPHLTDYMPELPTYPNPLQDNPAYSVVKQYFVNTDDTVTQKIVVRKNSARGTHFRRAGPRQRVYFQPDEVNAAIVTCGGLCPGLNTVIRELVCGLYDMYGVTSVVGIEGGYKGFYSRNTVTLTPKSVNDIHKRGGTILGTSRGGHDTAKIVDSLQDRGINQVYIIGGDGTQQGASVIYEVTTLLLQEGLNQMLNSMSHMRLLKLNFRKSVDGASNVQWSVSQRPSIMILR